MQLLRLLHHSPNFILHVVRRIDHVLRLHHISPPLRRWWTRSWLRLQVHKGRWREGEFGRPPLEKLIEREANRERSQVSTMGCAVSSSDDSHSRNLSPFLSLSLARAYTQSLSYKRSKIIGFMTAFYNNFNYKSILYKKIYVKINQNSPLYN